MGYEWYTNDCLGTVYLMSQMLIRNADINDGERQAGMDY